MQYRHTKHLYCLCGETVSSSFFSFAFNSLKNVNITPQHHMILSVLLHFYPGHLQLSHLQCSVPRSAFKDFCITRLGYLSALVDQRAKNWDQGLKAGWSSWGRRSKPSLHQLGDQWSAVSSPMDYRFKVLHAARATDNNCTYSVSGKRDQNVFFCNIFYKSHAILMTFGVQFPE